MSYRGEKEATAEPGNGVASGGSSPESSAKELIAQLLAAFEESAQAAAGQLWQSSAPGFRKGLAGEEHLAQLLGNELFAPLVGFQSLAVGELQRIEHAARQSVTVVTPAGERVSFLISLARSPRGARAGDWLVTGIARE